MKLPFRTALWWADMVVELAFFLMQNYLTDVWKLSFTHAAAILNIWGGIYKILPVFFLFLADTILGNFTMLALSSVSSSVGIVLITISSLPVFGNSTSTCKQSEAQCSIGHTEKVLFFTGMALLAVGRAGRLATADSFADEQRIEANDEAGPLASADCFADEQRIEANDEHPEKSTPLRCISISLIIIIVMVTPLIGFFAFPYIKKWFVLFGVSAICTAFATLVYLSGWRTYNKVKPQGSPITDVCRVFVAAAFKRSQPFPGDDKQIYVKGGNEFKSFSPTRFLRCLDKAAIILPNESLEDQVKNRWRLCSVEEVEAAKIAVRMVPMCATFIICAVVSSIGNTYFVEQASHMNPKIGKWKVPPQILLLIFMWAKRGFDESAAELLSKDSEKDGPPFGIAMGSVLCCITAAKIEIRRLKVIRRHDLLDKPNDTIPMSAYWLLFQFVLLGGLDSFFEKSVAAFYEDQSPESMRKYLDCFREGVSGLGYMCSVLSVYVVGKVSEKGGKTSWFQYTLNKSRLDRYYWVLAALSSVNLVVFILVASCYRYKNQKEEAVQTQGSAAGVRIGQ